MIKQMREWITTLNSASEAYENTGRSLLSNKQWDELYEKVRKAEEETGIILSNSPTQKVGTPSLTRKPHKRPALSLDKTKDREAFQAFLRDESGVLSWKLDGLTICITYEDGRLTEALTRGDGEYGDDVTENVKRFQNVPIQIPVSGTFTVRGEALMTYADFDRINESQDVPYANPRNLAAGVVRSLDMGNIPLYFYAFDATAAKGSYMDLLTILERLGFTTVPHALVTRERLFKQMDAMEKLLPALPYPTDGLVLRVNDLASRPEVVSHHPKNAYAFKWADDSVPTTIRSIFWSASRIGRLTPVAVFDPVKLEGSTVSRASLHNVSIMEALHAAPGQTAYVYKANKIIPQIERCEGEHLTTLPTCCPVCHGTVTISRNEDVKMLWCDNPACPAKKLGAFERLVCRDALDIQGLSTKTLELLISEGLLREFSDIFLLRREDLLTLPGFGETSVNALLTAIQASRNVKPEKALYALGIPTIGRRASKAILTANGGDIQAVLDGNLPNISDVKPFMKKAVNLWRVEEGTLEEAGRLIACLNLIQEKTAQNTNMSGKTFVITGALSEPRANIQARIEASGGKVTGSVSKNTDYLVTNNPDSGSTKAKKAQALNIPILTEAALTALLNGTDK